jgi:hypothetical protein
MQCADSFERVLVLCSIALWLNAPALNVNIIIPGHLGPTAFLMNRIRFALCPQGRCALSTDRSVAMPVLRSLYCFYYDVWHAGRSMSVSRRLDRDCREPVRNVQEGKKFLFSRTINVHTIRPQFLKKTSANGIRSQPRQLHFYSLEWLLSIEQARPPMLYRLRRA